MNYKNVLATIFFISMITGCASNKNKATSSSDGFQTLFDGQTLKGWHGYGHGDIKGRWKAIDNALVLDTTVKLSGVNGNLISDESYENFDLQVDWKIAPNGNSGILFLVHEDTALYNEPYFTGPEMQVLDNDGHPDGKIIKHRAGDLYDLITSSPETVKPWGEWNHVEIKSVNGKLDMFLNGTNVISTTLWNDNWNKLIAGSKFKDMPDFGTFKKGHIALQDHGFDVWYKNITIKKL